MIQNLASAIVRNNQPAVVSGDVIFSGDWVIFCSLLGNVSARLRDDKNVSFTIGNINQSADTLANAFFRSTSAL